MTFLPGVHVKEDKGFDEICFVFNQSTLLVYRTGDVIQPVNGRMILKSNIKSRTYIGESEGRSCFLLELHSPETNEGEYIGLRELFGFLSEDNMMAAGYAFQIRAWLADNRFCGRCGKRVTDKEGERALICTSCSHVIYPRINPCIIVSVCDGERILLARSVRFAKTGFYSVLAGFVEPGETLEACIRREVMEEVNVCVKNIRYFGSQPWPFSSSLMVGFTAEYESGDIKIQTSEIVDAKWFTKHNLPDVPGWGSIAGRLIDNFIGKPEK